MRAIEKGKQMPTSTVKDAQELPVVLTMRHVQEILGCAKDVAYRLPHLAGFRRCVSESRFGFHVTNFYAGLMRRPKATRNDDEPVCQV